MADKRKARPSDAGKRKEGSKIEEEEKKEEEPPPKPNVKTMPIQDYLEDAVVPLLMEGCRKIATERPPNPVATLAEYLLDKDPTSPRNIARATAEAEAKKKEEEDKVTEDPKPRKKLSLKKK